MDICFYLFQFQLLYRPLHFVLPYLMCFEKIRLLKAKVLLNLLRIQMYYFFLYLDLLEMSLQFLSSPLAWL